MRKCKTGPVVVAEPVPRAKGVVFREGALAGEGGHDGGLEKLGQFLKLGPGFGVEDALTGVDDGSLGGEESLGCFTDLLGIAAAAELSDGPVGLDDGVVYVGLEDVRGQFEKDGAGTAGPELAEGPPHHVGDAGGYVDAFRPLGDFSVALGWGEGGADAGPVERGRSGKQEDGYGIGVGLGHAGVSVFGPGARLHGKDASAASVGDAAEAIGEVDSHPFLAKDDGPDAGNSGGFLQGVVGDAPHEVHTLFL